jgi:hypothetical protein
LGVANGRGSDGVGQDPGTPFDHAEPRVAAAIEAGGHLVSDQHAPSWWTLADAEGYEATCARGRATSERNV